MALSGSLTAGYWYSENGQSRGYTLSWSATQSIANNQSTITWWVDTAGTYPYTVAERTLKVTLAGKTLIDKTDRVMRGAGRVASGSFTVTHDSTGYLAISGSIQAAVYTSAVNCSNSNSWTLNSIPRAASISSAPNFDDESNATITYSNPAGTAVTSLQACISWTGGADIAYRNIDKTGSSYTFNFTEEEREALRLAVTGSNSRTVKFYVTTVIGGNTYYSTLDRTLTIINGTPTLKPSVVDVNDKTFELTGDEHILIRNFSNALVESGATVYKEATIESQRVICGSKSLSDGSGIIAGVSSGSFIFSVTDNRKNTVSTTVNVPFVEYVNLTCNLNAKFPNAEGEFTFSVDGNYFAGSFGSVDNSIEVYYRYKAGFEEYGDWIKVEDIVTYTEDNTYVANISLSGLDYQNKYTFQAMSIDALIQIESVEKVVKTVPVFDWGENDFNFNVPVTVLGESIGGYGYIYGHVKSSAIVEAYGVIPFVLEEQIGDYFTIASDGSVVVGENVNLVRVTAIVGGAATNSSLKRCWAYIRKNGTEVPHSRAIQYGAFTSPVCYQILKVESGDVITVGTTEQYEARGGGVHCTIRVERIR